VKSLAIIGISPEEKPMKSLAKVFISLMAALSVIPVTTSQRLVKVLVNNPSHGSCIGRYEGC
jgi:hypothetical protein